MGVEKAVNIHQLPCSPSPSSPPLRGVGSKSRRPQGEGKPIVGQPPRRPLRKRGNTENTRASSFVKGDRRACPIIPSPLRERVGVRVEGYESPPPHLASPPLGGEELWVVGQPQEGDFGIQRKTTRKGGSSESFPGTPLAQSNKRDLIQAHSPF